MLFTTWLSYADRVTLFFVELSHLSWQLNAPVELLNGHEAGIGEPASSVLLTQTPEGLVE